MRLEVVDYDPAWLKVFNRLRDRLWPVVSGSAIGIEHVGSTSVPGLAAKPIVDLDIVIPSRAMLPEVVASLATVGYRHQGDLGIPDREAFAAPADQPRHHLYACVAGSYALRNHIALRDYLRQNPAGVAEYSALKKRLAEQFPWDIDRYVAGKTDFIVSVLTQRGVTAES